MACFADSSGVMNSMRGLFQYGLLHLWQYFGSSLSRYPVPFRGAQWCPQRLQWYPSMIMRGIWASLMPLPV